MTTVRPAYLDHIETNPKYTFDYESFKREQQPPTTAGPKSIVEDIKPSQPTIQLPSASAQVGAGRTVIDAKKVKDTVKPQVRPQRLPSPPSEEIDDSIGSEKPTKTKSPTPKKQPQKKAPSQERRSKDRFGPTSAEQ